MKAVWLNELPDSEKEIYFLRLEGIKGREIARYLGVPHPSIRSLVWRVRRKLMARSGEPDWRKIDSGVKEYFGRVNRNKEREGCLLLRDAIGLLSGSLRT